MSAAVVSSPRIRGQYYAPLLAWFASKGWRPSAFQREAWLRYRQGKSGLIVTPTGSGKTLAALGGPLLEALAEGPGRTVRRHRRGTPEYGRVRILWITPLRALANDTACALREPVEALGLPWTVALRTGDASAKDKRIARQGKVDVLVTTPESLELLLSYEETAKLFAGVRSIVVDEWHELIASKRGVLLQLSLARLRRWRPSVRMWGISATLGNIEQACKVLLPHVADAAIVRGAKPRQVTIDTLLPAPGARFPWAGHLGLSQLEAVVAAMRGVRTTLIFTNTRAHAELWYQALRAVWLDEAETLALHHGSLDPSLRRAAEHGLRDGTIRCVVATSSLDLGVDFPAVDQVIQIGGPRSAARLLQRAGRSRHRPGEWGHVICVPTHALELAEFAAVREALAAGEIDPRYPLTGCVDVLAQHCITMALAGGFAPRAMLDEVRSTHAYASLSDSTWTTVLNFIERGGDALQHYPDFNRVVVDADGMYRVTQRRIAMRHRMAIGTIVSEGAVQVRMVSGGKLGIVDEAFVARLRARDRFQFAGRTVELVRLHDMTAYVRTARAGAGVMAKWQGHRLPLAASLGKRVEAILGRAADAPEMIALAPIIHLQAKLSAVPATDILLVEQIKSRQGWHTFIYPFAGRAIHEALASLIAYRWSRVEPNTFGFAVNDYGIVVSAANETHLDEERLRAFLSPAGLVENLRHGVNVAELARRQFREIARIAGLLPPSLPGKAQRSLRQLQASSGLLYDVLVQHDPSHILLRQAEQEALSEQLELHALEATLAELHERRWMMCTPRTLTPLAFPLWAESRRGALSSEDWKVRVERAAQRLEKRYAKLP
jgi:ATP-dependent Lhr-like helicase